MRKTICWMIMIMLIGLAGAALAEPAPMELLLEMGTGSTAESATLSDPDTIQTILDMLDTAVPAQAVEDTGWSRDTKIVLTFASGERYEVYWSNWRFEPTYLLREDGLYEMDHGVGEYLYALASTLLWGQFIPEVEPSHAALFADYGWVLDYGIGSTVEKLPEKLVCRADDEASYYWVFHALLMRDTGMDITPALGQDVAVTIYRVHPLEQGAQRAIELPRGIVLSQGETVLGALLSQGYDARRAWSLKGNDYQALLGDTTLDAWLARESELTEKEAALVPLEPKAVLESYLKAWMADDIEGMIATTAKSKTLSYMLNGCGDDRLYSRMEERLKDPLNSKIVQIYKVALCEEEHVEQTENRKVFTASWRIDENRFDPPAGNDISRYVVMVQESVRTGWRVEAFNTGM